MKQTRNVIQYRNLTTFYLILFVMINQLIKKYQPPYLLLLGEDYSTKYYQLEMSTMSKLLIIWFDDGLLTTLSQCCNVLIDGKQSSTVHRHWRFDDHDDTLLWIPNCILFI